MNAHADQRRAARRVSPDCVGQPGCAGPSGVQRNLPVSHCRRRVCRDAKNADYKVGVAFSEAYLVTKCAKPGTANTPSPVVLS